jgi:hypothetical protein
MATNGDTCSNERSPAAGDRHRNRGRPHHGDGRRLQDHVNRRQCPACDDHYGRRAHSYGFLIRQASADRIEDQARVNAHQVADYGTSDSHANGDAAGRGPDSGSAAPASHGITGFYVFPLDHNETSGTVYLKAMLQTMVSLGYIPATSPLTQIPFGWEISDTGGKPVTFSLSRFDVNLQN